VVGLVATPTAVFVSDQTHIRPLDN